MCGYCHSLGGVTGANSDLYISFGETFLTDLLARLCRVSSYIVLQARQLFPSTNHFQSVYLPPVTSCTVPHISELRGKVGSGL